MERGDSLAEACLEKCRQIPQAVCATCTLAMHSRGSQAAGFVFVGLGGVEDKAGAFHQDMEPQEWGLRQDRAAAVGRPGKYLVLMAPIVVEGSANESTPDQLGVTVLYLSDRNEWFRHY